MDADTRFVPIAGNLLAYASEPPRDLRVRAANCSGSGGLAELSERQGLSIDLGAPVLSLSVGDNACGSVASDSVGVSEWRTEEQFVNEVGDRESLGCWEARGRELDWRCDCCTRTGYGDSWSKTIEVDEPSRTNRGGDFGVSRGCTFGGYRSAGETRLATDSRDALSEVGVGERCTEGPGRFGKGNSDGGDARPDPVHEGGALPGPAETEDFLFFLQSDLMLLTGLSEVLPVRLFLPSSVESSEKRLDGGADTGSV